MIKMTGTPKKMQGVPSNKRIVNRSRCYGLKNHRGRSERRKGPPPRLPPSTRQCRHHPTPPLHPLLIASAASTLHPHPCAPAQGPCSIETRGLFAIGSEHHFRVRAKKKARRRGKKQKLRRLRGFTKIFFQHLEKYFVFFNNIYYDS